MSSTSLNSTNSTDSAPLSSMSVASSISTGTNVTNNAIRQINSTSTGTTPATTNTGDSLLTLLTFGPLSSCVTLPDLTASSTPLISNLSGVVSQQAVNDWLEALPAATLCSKFSWTFRPDYSPQLEAVMKFQNQLQTLFPTTGNATAASEALLKAQSDNTPGFNTTSSTAFASLSPNGSTVPETLPLWIGITLACTVLVHLLSLVLHVFSDLDALCPSLASKLQSTEERVLPCHASPNASSTTLVEASPDDKADPPLYIEPSSVAGKAAGERGLLVGLGETPAVIRFSRKIKSLVVPMLLLSALAMMGVAMVLNAKFAVGPVEGLGSSLGGASGSQSSSHASWVTGSSETAPAAAPTIPTSSISIDLTRSNNEGAHNHSTVAVATNTNVGITDGKRRPALDDTPSTTASTTGSMIKLVRRQTDFFPTPPSTTSLLVPATTITASPSSSPASSSLSTTVAPNTSLFPTTLPSTISQASPTPTTGISNTFAAPLGSEGSSGTGPLSCLVIERGDSIHRMWWIVMLDLVLWFVQRRRTRSQTAMDKARTALIGAASTSFRTA